MTLCNLSTHTDCKAALVSLHGLPPLIEMLEGESDLVKRYAAMTLCNLSTLGINQVLQRFPFCQNVSVWCWARCFEHVKLVNEACPTFGRKPNPR